MIYNFREHSKCNTALSVIIVIQLGVVHKERPHKEGRGICQMVTLAEGVEGKCGRPTKMF